MSRNKFSKIGDILAVLFWRTVLIACIMAIAGISALIVYALRNFFSIPGYILLGVAKWCGILYVVFIALSIVTFLSELFLEIKERRK